MAHSIFGLRFAIWQLSLFSISAWAQTVQEDLWNVPNGKLPDLSETFTNGQSLTLSWNAFATTPYLDTADNLVDLWVTAWPPNTLTEFSQLLTGEFTIPNHWNLGAPSSGLV
jgi:hypothetical protein